MSKKTNSLNLRSIQKKTLKVNSFFEDYNYSKLLHQDLAIEDYLENVFSFNVFNSIVHDISIQRKKDKINIFLDYYYFKRNLDFKHTSRTISFVKRRFRWRNKKKFYLKYKKPKYQNLITSKYWGRPPKRKKLKKGTRKPNLMFNSPALFNLNIRKNKHIYVYSFKRLILLNLILLTGCRVRLYTRNIAPLLRLPDYFRIFKQIKKVKDQLNKRNTVRKVMQKLKIRMYMNRLNNLNVSNFVHLTCTSFVFKNPRLLGIFLSRVLKKNIKLFHIFFFFVKKTLVPLFLFSNLNGLKIQFKGRLGSSLRKRVSVIQMGSMPLQTIDSNIKYSFVKSMTIYGICGIKIWYYY